MSDDDAAGTGEDRVDVVCPRERSPFTPCIARDGHSALADDERCVGCDEAPLFLVEQLAERMAATLPPMRSAAAQADVLVALVRRYVDEKP